MNKRIITPCSLGRSLLVYQKLSGDPARAEDLKAPSARSRGREMPKNMHAGNLAHLATRSLEQALDEIQLLRSRAHFELVMNSTLALRELRILELRTLHRPARASHRSI
jgi:site-specific recombinase XerC